jgi:hypothetical protein
VISTFRGIVVAMLKNGCEWERYAAFCRIVQPIGSKSGFCPSIGTPVAARGARATFLRATRILDFETDLCGFLQHRGKGAALLFRQRTESAAALSRPSVPAVDQTTAGPTLGALNRPANKVPSTVPTYWSRSTTAVCPLVFSPASACQGGHELSPVVSPRFGMNEYAEQVRGFLFETDLKLRGNIVHP